MEAGDPASIDEAMEWLRKRFAADSARGLRVTFQFVLTRMAGTDGVDSAPLGGHFFARVEGGRLDVGIGEVPSPEVCFRLRASDFFAILAGRENADLLFTAGRIEIEGDLSLALKMRTLFRPQLVKPVRTEESIAKTGS